MSALKDRPLFNGARTPACVCVWCVKEREGERERDIDDDEHDDDAVGGCQGVLEYRHRSVT